MTEPSGRKLLAIVAILALILGCAVAAAFLSEWVGALPVLVQALFYLFLGLIWIAPLRPLIRWSETGSWRKPR